MCCAHSADEKTEGSAEVHLGAREGWLQSLGGPRWAFLFPPSYFPDPEPSVGAGGQRGWPGKAGKGSSALFDFLQGLAGERGMTGPSVSVGCLGRPHLKPWALVQARGMGWGRRRQLPQVALPELRPEASPNTTLSGVGQRPQRGNLSAVPDAMPTLGRGDLGATSLGM